MDSKFLLDINNEDSQVDGEEARAALRRFTGILRDKLRACAGAHLTNKQVARDVLAVLRFMLREESRSLVDPHVVVDPACGADNQTIAVQRMFEHLHRAPSYQDLFLRVQQICSEVLANGSQPKVVFDRERLLADVDTLVKWYEQRRLLLIELPTPNAVSGVRVFSPRYEHRVHETYGAGVAVLVAAQLSGASGESFWCRLGLISDGSPILLRHGWESWIDQTDSFLRVVQPPKEGAQLSFCGLVPMVLREPGALLDEVEFFVPFSALDIQTPEANIEFVVEVLDRVGRTLDSARLAAPISIPSSDTIPRLKVSPQAISLWSRNPVTRDSVSGLRVYQRTNDDGRGALIFECNLEVHGQRGRPLRVEWKLLTESGELVESDAPDVSTADGALCVVCEVVPQSPVALIDALQVSVPTDALLLPDGKHQLLVQAILLEQDGELLCGTVEPVEIAVAFGQAPAQRVKASKSTPAEQDPYSGLVMELFGVDPDSSLAGLPCIRLWVSLSQVLPGDRPYKVVVSVESDQVSSTDAWKMRPIRHSFLWKAHKSGGRRAIITNIPLEELRAAALRAGEQVRCVARAQVYSLDDQLVFNRTRIFNVPREVLNSLSAPTSDQRALIQFLHQARPSSELVRSPNSNDSSALLPGEQRSYIADIRMRALPGEPRIRSLVTVALPHSESKRQKVSIYHEIVDERGAAIMPSSTTNAGDPLTSGIATVCSDDLFLGKLGEGCLVQVSTELDDALASTAEALREGSYALKTMLFSEDGRLLHVVQQPLVVRHRRGASAEFPWLIDCDPHLSPERGTSSVPLLLKISKGLATWLRGDKSSNSTQA
ncbi:MAG: hypothetical protein K1X79_08655 [Oligoflexia bacterium]|nr:hypothetical protein [Oligoflexia bacterium]